MTKPTVGEVFKPMALALLAWQPPPPAPWETTTDERSSRTMDRTDISYLQDGTYAREPDGACHLYHSPFKFRDGTAALRNRDPRDNWRRVDSRLEVQSLVNLRGDLQPGEWLDV